MHLMCMNDVGMLLIAHTEAIHQGDHADNFAHCSGRGGGGGGGKSLTHQLNAELVVAL